MILVIHTHTHKLSPPLPRHTGAMVTGKNDYGMIATCLSLVELFDTVQNNSELFLRIQRFGAGQGFLFCKE